MTDSNPQPEAPTECASLPDERIMELLRSSPKDGLRALLSSYGERVRGTLEKGFRGREDVVDDAIIRAAQALWERPENFKPERGGLDQYFFSIARNFARQTLRKERIDRQLLAEWFEAPADSGTRSPGQERLISDLRVAISKLGPLQQAVVRADLLAEGSAPAQPIARAFGTSTNSIYVSRRKAYDKLAGLLKECGHFTGEGEK